MNVNLCRVALRPRGALEVFDLALVFWRANGRVLMRLWALMVVPPALALGLLAWAVDGSPWLVLAPWVFVPLVQMPFTVIGGRLLFQEDATARGALVDTVRAARALGAVLVSLAAGLAFTLSTCGYGGIPVMAALLYVPETALLERVPLTRGLGRSMRLAAGSFGAAFAGVGSQVGLTVWGAAVAEATGHLLVDTTLQLGQPFGSVLTGEVTPYVLLGVLAVQPLQAIYRLLLYVDARTRMDGWDLQVALRAARIARVGA